MAAYDSPGYKTPLPGVPDFQSHDSGMTAPGELGEAMGRPDGAPRSVVVTIPGASDVNSDTATVGAADSLMPNQVSGLARNPLTGQTGADDSGAGSGNVWPPRSAHPNNMNGDDAA